MPALFKYLSDDDNVIRGIFLEGRIRFTQPAALNDPLEFNPVIRFKQPKRKYTRYMFDGITFPGFQVWVSHQLIWDQIDRFGILSLTENPDNFDMWNHYANAHKGCLIEFNDAFNEHPCLRARNGEIYPTRRVEYMEEYAYSVEDLADDRGNIYPDEFNARMFFGKSSRWAYEAEWRMIRPLADHKWWHPAGDLRHRDREKYLFPFSLDCVRSVTFGACMSPQNRRKIGDACSGTKIQFLQAMILKDVHDPRGYQGTVTRNPIEDIHVLDDLPDMGLICDGLSNDEHHEIGKPAIEIKDLRELPYYVGNEDRVQRYYLRAKSGEPTTVTG